MAKTKEELEEIKKDFIELNTKLHELSEEELKEVTGGDQNIIWLYEKSFDFQTSIANGSIQNVIGEWNNKEH